LKKKKTLFLKQASYIYIYYNFCDFVLFSLFLVRFIADLQLWFIFYIILFLPVLVFVVVWAFL